MYAKVNYPTKLFVAEKSTERTTMFVLKLDTPRKQILHEVISRTFSYNYSTYYYILYNYTHFKKMFLNILPSIYNIHCIIFSI